MDRQSRLWVLVAPFTPVVPIALGVYWGRIFGAPAKMVLSQWVALALGVAAYVALSRWKRLATMQWKGLFCAATAMTVLLVVTLLLPGLEGVKRWMGLGPVRLHVGLVVGPAMVTAIGLFAAAGRWRTAVGFAVVVPVIQLLQPDAGSATGFGAGVIMALILARFLVARDAASAGNTGTRSASDASSESGAQSGSHAQSPRTVTAWWLAAVLVNIGVPVVTWTRPDPLLPVPYVEGIVELAATRGPWARAAAVDSLVWVPAVIGALVLAKKAAPRARMAAAGIAMFLAGATLATRFGAFPVPLLGLGASPILGVYVALGLTAALARQEPRGSQQPPTPASPDGPTGK